MANSDRVEDILSVDDVALPSSNLNAASIHSNSAVDDDGTASAHAPTSNDTSNPVIHVLLVGFHHSLGPIVEYAYPPLPAQSEKNLTTLNSNDESNQAAVKLPKEWSHLPFLALPDGVHHREEETVCFLLPLLESMEGISSAFKERSTAIFGVASYRQIESNQLLNKSNDVTRSTVQKSVCVLSALPLFGLLGETASAITSTLFNQRDFTDTTILENYYHSLNAMLLQKMDLSTLFLGLSVKDIILHYRHKALILFKALFLEKKIVVFGQPVKDMCHFILALVSLMPGFFESGLFASYLQTQNAISTNSFSKSLTEDYFRPIDAAQQQRRVFLRRLGIPLAVYSTGSVFQPYASLLQLQELCNHTGKGVLMGTSNLLFVQHTDIKADLFIDMTQNKFEIKDPHLRSSLSLSTEDLRFIDHIVETVDKVHVRNNTLFESIAAETIWEGSDAWIRQQFEKYTACFLAANLLHSSAFLSNQASSGANPLNDFNPNFVRKWLSTKNAALWKSSVDTDISDSIKHQNYVTSWHPNSGALNVADVGIKVASAIDPAIYQRGEKFSAALGEAIDSFSKTITKALKPVQREQDATPQLTVSSPPGDAMEMTMSGVEGTEQDKDGIATSSSSSMGENNDKEYSSSFARVSSNIQQSFNSAMKSFTGLWKADDGNDGNGGKDGNDGL